MYKTNDIDRNVPQPSGSALERVSFCLDQIEEYGVDFQHNVNKRLTMEEVVGALVSAEQYIKYMEKDLENENV